MHSFHRILFLTRRVSKACWRWAREPEVDSAKRRSGHNELMALYYGNGTRRLQTILANATYHPPGLKNLENSEWGRQPRRESAHSEVTAKHPQRVRQNASVFFPPRRDHFI